MHEPTRHPVRIYTSAHDREFPEGSIILTEHIAYPYIKRADGWTRSLDIRVTIPAGTIYRVLYVPGPPPSKVGDELHGTSDTDALPDNAVVVEGDGQVYQQGGGVWYEPGSDQPAAHPPRFPVTLLWLPGGEK